MKQAIETMKQAGYKVYATKGSDFISTERSRGGWVFAITPSDNVLYVQRGEFGGWEISLQYTPSRKNGIGCRATGYNRHCRHRQLLAARRKKPGLIAPAFPLPKTQHCFKGRLNAF